MKLCFGLTAIVLLGMAGCQHSDEQRRPLFTYDGRTFGAKDLSIQVQKEIFTARHQLYQSMLGHISSGVIELYIAEKAEAADVPPEKLRAELLMPPEPSEEDLKKFFDENRSKFPYTFEMIKPEIKEYLVEQNKNQARYELLRKIREEKGVTLLIQSPEAPALDIDIQAFPSFGNKAATHVLVEYADFMCPVCRAVYPSVKKLKEKYADRLLFVYKYLPLHGSFIGRRLSQGGVCASKVEKFWQYHDYVYDNQDKMSWNGPMDAAKALQLDENSFRTCLLAEETAAVVEQSMQEALNHGFTATPTFVLNGQLVVNGYDPAILEAELKKLFGF